MATAAVMLPEGAIPIVLPTEAEQTGIVSSIETSITNPLLETYTSLPVEELLESVIDHIENHLEASQMIMSPTDMPLGIQDSHSRQIDVCLKRFKAAKVPVVTLRDYLQRLHYHCPFSTSKLLAIVHYISVLDVLYLRIAKVVQQTTVHRLVLTAVVMASKILDDRLIPQIRWSVVGGIPLHQLHGLELAFFFLMNGKCWLNENCLINAGQRLQGHVQSITSMDPMLETKEKDIIWSDVGNCSPSSAA